MGDQSIKRPNAEPLRFLKAFDPFLLGGMVHARLRHQPGGWCEGTWPPAGRVGVRVWELSPHSRDYDPLRDAGLGERHSVRRCRRVGGARCGSLLSSALGISGLEDWSATRLLGRDCLAAFVVDILDRR